MKQMPIWRGPRALVLYVCVLLFAAMANFGGRLGAMAGTLPAPIYLPLPEAVRAADMFGYSLATDGDILVVGAPWTNVGSAEQQGVVYIYARIPSDASGFTLLKSLTGSDSAAFHAFGWSIDIHGDTLVVGNADTGAGAVYLFARNLGGDNNWGEVKKLVRDDGRSLTYFGRTVALYGDTLVVGDALGLGQAFVYVRNQGGADQWGKTQTLDSGLPPTTSIKVAAFGEQIAINGTTLAIVAPKLGLTDADVPAGSPALPANYAGAVFVYQQAQGQWALDATLFSSDLDLTANPLPDDSFGASVAIRGDLLFVGAPVRDPRTVQSGKVFVYQQGAGTAPPFGQPGAWGELFQLSPLDGQARDRFGSALYPVDDYLFVSAERQGIGTVYLFGNPSAATLSGTALTQAQDDWRQLYGFTTSVSGSATAFGLPITGSGNLVVIGDSSAGDGRGGIAAYALDTLVSADPNATPTPSPTAPVTPQPAEPQPCVVGQSDVTNRLFLPLMAGDAGLAGAASPPSVQTTVDMTPFSGRLAPGCVITGPAGVIFGAVSGAITQSVALTIAVTGAPSLALPEGAVAQGEYLRITSAITKHVDVDLPFVFGVAVPEGADTDHLGLIHLTAAEHILDSQTTGAVWGYLPGVFDAASRRFLTAMPFVLAEGATFLLVQHPDFDSPPNQPHLNETAAADVGAHPSIFTIHCMPSTFRNPTDCTQSMEDEMKLQLDEIYGRMTDVNIFGYPRRLRLLSRDANYIVSETVTRTLVAGYSAFIEGPKSTLCEKAAGYYMPSTGYMALCTQPRDPVDADEQETLIHELFHAVEFTYPAVLKDRDDGFEQAWIIEGMAASAQVSYAETQMRRTGYFGAAALQKVDTGLTTPVATDNILDEYWAQDFWVYVGASHGKNLGYLKPFLELGGSHRGRYDQLFLDEFGESFRDIYWKWVRNQSIENIYIVGESPGDYCTFTKEAVENNLPAEFQSVDQLYPLDDLYDVLPPLSARVVEIKFPETRTSAAVVVGYQRCMGITDGLAKAACTVVAQFDLRVKVYVNNETTCFNDNLPGVVKEGIRQLDNLSPLKRYFVVVANVDPLNAHGYYLAIE